MAETKKFLDQDGVAFLWSKLSMQDYPNNDVLMAVITAIDETKADKTDLVQSDWNESDETSLSYIKNRPFYTEGTNVYSIDEKYIPDTIARSEEFEEITSVEVQALFSI